MFEVAFYEKDWHYESGDVMMTRKLDVVSVILKEQDTGVFHGV